MQQNKPPLIDLQNISLEINKRVILEDINLKVQVGETVTLIGPNGAGKSTLLKIALGLIKPSGGKVSLAKGLKIGYMPQKLMVESLMPLTVSRFLLLAPRANAAKSALAANQLGIQEYLNTPIQSISGGELQRVLLARAILNEPDLLVLDEPAQGIDINGQAALYQLILNVRDKLQCGILMVSHDLHLVIAGTDQVVCLNKHICCSGHPATITHHPEFIQLFGSSLAEGLAVYTHHHDHKHDLEGNIVDD
jgi:zinc transport system ATP-binding protein